MSNLMKTNRLLQRVAEMKSAEVSFRDLSRRVAVAEERARVAEERIEKLQSQYTDARAALEARQEGLAAPGQPVNVSTIFREETREGSPAAMVSMGTQTDESKWQPDYPTLPHANSALLVAFAVERTAWCDVRTTASRVSVAFTDPRGFQRWYDPFPATTSVGDVVRSFAVAPPIFEDGECDCEALFVASVLWSLRMRSFGPPSTALEWSDETACSVAGNASSGGLAVVRSACGRVGVILGHAVLFESVFHVVAVDGQEAVCSWIPASALLSQFDKVFLLPPPPSTRRDAVEVRFQTQLSAGPAGASTMLRMPFSSGVVATALVHSDCRSTRIFPISILSSGAGLFTLTCPPRPGIHWEGDVDVTVRLLVPVPDLPSACHVTLCARDGTPVPHPHQVQGIDRFSAFFSLSSAIGDECAGMVCASIQRHEQEMLTARHCIGAQAILSEFDAFHQRLKDERNMLLLLERTKGQLTSHADLFCFFEQSKADVFSDEILFQMENMSMEQQRHQRVSSKVLQWCEDTVKCCSDSSSQRIDLLANFLAVPSQDSPEKLQPVFLQSVDLWSGAALEVCTEYAMTINTLVASNFASLSASVLSSLQRATLVIHSSAAESQGLFARYKELLCEHQHALRRLQESSKCQQTGEDTLAEAMETIADMKAANQSLRRAFAHEMAERDRYIETLKRSARLPISRENNTLS